MPLTAGDLLQGRYRIREPLATGGAGAVFVAQEEPSGLPCVVKELQPAGAEVLSSFRAEFALLARSSHPHLVRVLDFGTALIGGTQVHYYVAQWLDASPLAETARKSGAAVAQLLNPLLDALEGLSALHAQEIRHGDFTPSNVMVDGAGRGTLIDLGCAQPFGATLWLSGTEGFIAPELLRGERADARADLYSAGKTLECVFGLARQEPPAHVARIIERLVRADPADRPADVREVLEAFKRRVESVPRHLVPTRLLGRQGQLSEFAGWLSALERDQPGPRAFVLSGGPGVGLSRLLREMTWRAQLEVQVFRVSASDAECVGRCLAIAAGLEQPVRSLRGVLLAHDRLKESREPLLLVVEDHERLDADQRELLLSACRVLEPSGKVAVLLSGRSAPAGVNAVVAECGALELQEVSAWVAPFLPARRVREFFAATAGLPGAIETELRRLQAAPDHSSYSSLAESDVTLPASKSAAARALAVITAAGGELEVAPPLLDWSAVQELIALQLGERDGGRVRLYRRTLTAIAAGGLSRKAICKGHLELAETIASASPETNAGVVARLALHLAEAQEQARAEQTFLRFLPELRQQPRATVALFRSAFRKSVNGEVQLAGAELMLAAGEPRLAVRAAIRAWRSNPACAAEAATFVVDGLRGLGQPARAQALLERWLKRRDTAGDARLIDRLARTRLARGDYAGARRDAEKALRLGGSPVTASLAAETRGSRRARTSSARSKAPISA